MTVSGLSLDKIIDLVYEQVRKQGFNILILLFGLWYLNEKNERMNEELQKCNSLVLQMYREDRMQTYELVQNNTKALNELKESIKNQK